MCKTRVLCKEKKAHKNREEADEEERNTVTNARFFLLFSFLQRPIGTQPRKTCLKRCALLFRLQ